MNDLAACRVNKVLEFDPPNQPAKDGNRFSEEQL